MRSTPFYIFSLSLIVLYLACTAPVEQKQILTQVGSRQIYFSHQEKTNLAWAPDSSKLAFQTPVGLVTLLKYSTSGELLDTLLTLNVPYFDENIAPVFLSPNGDKVLYQKTEKKFNVVESATGESQSYRFPDLQFISPMRWAEDGATLYATTQEEERISLVVFDPQSSEMTFIELDSVNECSAAQLYDGTTVLYTGIAKNGSRGVWLKKLDGSITRISAMDAVGMVYFPEHDVVICYQYDAELNQNVIKKYSLDDQSSILLNDDFESIWNFERVPGDNIQIGGSHQDARLGIYTLSLNGELQQISNWWPFEPAQWADNGQAVVAQKVLDDNFSAIYVYDLHEDRLIGLSETALPDFSHTPVFTPNSQFVVFSRNGQLVRVPAHGGEVFALTPSNTPAQHNPEVSPNGAWIVCDDGRDIYIVPVEGGELKKISGGLNMSLFNPTWSPDGQKIACQTQGTLEILSFDGQQLAEDKSFSGQFDKIEWARAETPPFGAPILYQNYSAGIATINPENGVITDAFSFRHDLVSFCWAENGRDIIYTTPWLVLYTPLLSSLSQ